METKQEATVAEIAVPKVSGTEKLIRNMTQPLKPWEYLLNALIMGVVTYGVFKGMDFIVNKVQEVRKASKAA